MDSWKALVDDRVDGFFKLGDTGPYLGPSVPISQCYCIVLHRVIVYCDTEGNSRLVCTRIPSSDGPGIVILDSEAFLGETIVDASGLLYKTILVDEGVYRRLYWGELER